MSLSTEPDVARDILTVSTTLTGLMVLEYAWNIRFEMRVIWPQFWKGAEAKIFVIARYLGLAGEIFNVWFASRMASGIPTHPLVCRVCYSFHGITIQCLLMSVELLLILLACKMYNNDRFVLGLLYALVGVQWAGMAITVRLLVSDLRPSPTCAVESNSSQIYVGSENRMCCIYLITNREPETQPLQPTSASLLRYFGDTSQSSGPKFYAHILKLWSATVFLLSFW